MHMLQYYLTVGFVFFLISQVLSMFGRAFTGEKWNPLNCLTEMLVFGFFWPAGLYLVIHFYGLRHDAGKK